jgi:glycosyltransferase involved in cell wall biosynthesis
MVSAQSTVIVVRVPFTPPYVRYRAYAESLEKGTVLDWILGRIRENTPRIIPVVCVCASASEPQRLRAASSSPDEINFLWIDGPGELHQYRMLMDWRRVQRLIVMGFSHALAPKRAVSDLLRLHDSLDAELTEVSDATFADRIYVVQSSLIRELLNAPPLRRSHDVLTGAAFLRDTRKQDSRVARDFVWLHINASVHYAIARDLWPENITLQSSRDVEILRETLSQTCVDSQGCDNLIDSWKRAAIIIRQRRASRGSQNARHSHPNDSGRIRVLYGSGSAALSGAAQSLCHLVGALDRDRYEPLALIPYRGAFTDQLSRRNVTVICPNDDFTSNSLENLQLARRILAEYAPHVVHSNHSIGMPLACAALEAGVPLVQHVRVQAPRAIRELIYTADAVIAVSYFVRAKIAELDIDLGKVDVIWNGVDIVEVTPDPVAKILCRRRLGISPDEFVVTMIARLAANKRHDLVVDAVGQLRRSTGRGHLLLVAGFDGDFTYSHYLRAQIAHNGLTGHVTLMDFTDDVRTVLHASDVLALPSEEEPLARAVLEAMAVGLPVIVSDSGGTKEIIDPGVTGLVVPCGKAEPLVLALRSLEENPEWAKTMGTLASNKIRSCLTAQICAEKTMLVYERVLDAARQRGELPSRHLRVTPDS